MHGHMNFKYKKPHFSYHFMWA